MFSSWLLVSDSVNKPSPTASFLTLKKKTDTAYLPWGTKPSRVQLQVSICEIPVLRFDHANPLWCSVTVYAYGRLVHSWKSNFCIDRRGLMHSLCINILCPDLPMVSHCKYNPVYQIFKTYGIVKRSETKMEQSRNHKGASVWAYCQLCGTFPPQVFFGDSKLKSRCIHKEPILLLESF